MTYMFKSRSQAISMGMGFVPTWTLCPSIPTHAHPKPMGMGMGMDTRCRALSYTKAHMAQHKCHLNNQQKIAISEPQIVHVSVSLCIL
jgi:hypothetical protein